MRITNNMMITNMMRNLNRNMLQLDKRQMQVSTGKRIHRPSDDPIAISRVLKIRSDIQELDQYKKNADDAISWLEATELAIINTSEAMHRLRELTVQAANGVLTGEETQKIQQEAKEIKQQIIHLGNTTYAGKYIFSGKKTDIPLFDHFGNYNIDLFDAKNPNLVDHRMQYEVGVGELIEINTLGIDFFENYTNASDLTLDFPKKQGQDHAVNFEFQGIKIEVIMTKEAVEADDTVTPPIAYESPEYRAIGKVVVGGEEGDIDLGTIEGIQQDVAEGIMNRLNDIIENEIEDQHHILKNYGFRAEDLKQGRITSGQEVAEENWTIKAIPQKAGLIHLIETIEGYMLQGKYEELNNRLGEIDQYMNALSTTRAEIGAKANRMELVQNRIADDKINFTQLQSQLEDADMGEVLMQLMNEENVYRSALAIGARIIQPTLLDFLR